MLFGEMCSRNAGRSLVKKIGLNIILLMILLTLSINAIAQVEDVEISEPASVFISTFIQLVLDKKIGFELYTIEEPREKIRKQYTDMVVREAASVGSADPESVGKLFSQVGEQYQLFVNYETDVTATSYTIGRMLEDKGVLTDVNAAVKKANELVEQIQTRFDELSTDYSWNDLFLANFEGYDLFFKRNIVILPSDFVLLFKRFFEHISRLQEYGLKRNKIMI